MSSWKLREIETGARWQIEKDDTVLTFTRYEYDAHPDHLWICLYATDYCYASEIYGEGATAIYALLAANGVTGELYKEKNYRLNSDLPDV